MSTISVTSDSQLSSLVSGGAKSGDILQLSNRRFTSNGVTFANSGVTLDGNSGATIYASDNQFAFKLRDGKGASFVGITFDGGAVFFDGKVENVTFDWCDLTNFGRGSDVGAGSGAIGGSGGNGNNVTIKNCRFHDAPTGMGFNVWRCDNLNIYDNSFVRVLGAIKSNNSGSTCKNQHIERNYFAENRRHAVELQGCVAGFWLNDNYYEKPTLSGNFDENKSTFAFSVIYTAVSSDQHILRNYVNTTERPDGTGVRIAFEAGEYCEIRDNYINGTGTPVTIYGPGSKMDANYINNALHPSYIYGDQRGNNSVITSNNNASVKVSWDINRPKPGPKSSTVPPDPTMPDLKVTVAKTASKSSLSVTYTLDPNASTYKASITTEDGKNLKDLGVVTVSPFVIEGLNAATDYTVTIYAQKSNGGTASKGSASAKVEGKAPVESDAAWAANPTGTGAARIVSEATPEPEPVRELLVTITQKVYTDGHVESTSVNA